LRHYMTRTVEALRFAGFAIAAFGAWWHASLAIVLGLCAIAACWIVGIVRPRT
jgi:hypothetical protein